MAVTIKSAFVMIVLAVLMAVGAFALTSFHSAPATVPSASAIACTTATCTYPHPPHTF